MLRTVQIFTAFCVISGLRREVAENRALLRYYAASRSNFLPTFRDNLSVPTAGFKNPKESLWLQYGIYTGKSLSIML